METNLSNLKISHSIVPESYLKDFPVNQLNEFSAPQEIITEKIKKV